MLCVKFARNSLLYGESVFWLLTSFFVPFVWTPNFEETKHHTIVHELPQSDKLIKFYARLTSYDIVRNWDRLVSVTQVMYLIFYVFLGIAFQNQILESFGVVYKADSLTYKTLYYSPTLFRIGLFIISVSALTRFRYDAWRCYDRADYFAVDESFQRKTILLCLSSIVPDCVSNVSETFLILSRIGSTEYFKRLSQPGGASSVWMVTAELAVSPLFFGLSMVNVLMRYKPIIDMMYLSACVRRHFHAMSQQIFLDPGKTRVAIYSRPDPDQSTTTRLDQDNSAATNHSEPRRPANGVALAKSECQNGAERSDQVNSYLIANADGQRRVGPTLALTSLHQLERHLTQVHLFVSRADRQAPATVLALVLSNTMGFYYIILYNIQSGGGASQLTNAISLISLFARSMPIVTLFVLGHALERECRQLLNKLEVIYLQQQSQTLIYKQMVGSHYSLGRVFKLIEATKFDCNGLMEVNLKTLFKCVAYVCGGILLVLQYDLIIFS